MKKYKSYNKRDPITESDIKGRGIRERFVDVIEIHRQFIGKEKSDYSILDFGCGKGTDVVCLHEMGYKNACGVDINENFIENGRDYFNQRGKQGEKILFVIKPDGTTGLDPASFDFIFSSNVLEHVAQMDVFFQETSRLMSEEGVSYHIFPSAKRIMEGHTMIPLVHWVSDRKFRKFIIYLFLNMGFGIDWKTATTEELVEKYLDFLEKKTFYRSVKQVTAVAEKYRLKGRIIKNFNWWFKKRMPAMEFLGSLNPVKVIITYFMTAHIVFAKEDKYLLF